MKPWWQPATCSACGTDAPMHQVATSPTAYATYCDACLPDALRQHGFSELAEKLTETPSTAIAPTMAGV